MNDRSLSAEETLLELRDKIRVIKRWAAVWKRAAKSRARKKCHYPIRPSYCPASRKLEISCSECNEVLAKFENVQHSFRYRP